MNILILGDVFGKNGKRAIANELANLKKQYNIDLTIANGENVTNCRGLNFDDYQFLINNGIDLITMGNHTWKQDDYINVLSQSQIIRPLNINHQSSFSKIGVGYKIINIKNKKIRVINVLGKNILMKIFELTNPYNEVLEILNNQEDVDINIIDFHADTTSEKYAALRILSNKAQIIVGTHSHVQTNDAMIVDNCAYITDVGMCGSYEGIIGAKKDSLIEMFLDKSNRFKLTEADGKYQFNAVLVQINDQTNIPENIKPIFIVEK